jgi:glycosyltransferase involved in cell wall biosynthesis
MAHRLRIAYVYRDFNRDGSLHTFFLERAERLARDEDVIAVCSARTRAPTTAPIRFETVEPFVRGRGRLSYALESATFAFRAARAVRRLRDRLDVVHVVGYAAPEADLVTVNAVRPAELVQYFERVEPRARLRRRLAPLLRPQSAVVQVIERHLFRPPFPLCLAETRAVADDLMRYYGVPADAVEVIAAGVDLDAFGYDAVARARTRAAFATPESRLVVLFVGDDFERKGLDRAIRALARVTVDAELWVVGGEAHESYLHLAHSLGCAGRIRFLGRVRHEELPAMYAGCDVLLLPSRQDAWGQPVLEALACGRVAIASEYTGAHEILEHGVNGFVLDGAGRPEQIAALLDGPLADLETRRRIAERATATAARFDREPLYEQLRRAHHTAYARRLRHLREQAGSR